MNTSFISDQRERKQQKHYDQDDALLVFREFENSEKAFHLLSRSAEGVSTNISVMLSEALQRNGNMRPGFQTSLVLSSVSGHLI